MNPIRFLRRLWYRHVRGVTVWRDNAMSLPARDGDKVAVWESRRVGRGGLHFKAGDGHALQCDGTGRSSRLVRRRSP